MKALKGTFANKILHIILFKLLNEVFQHNTILGYAWLFCSFHSRLKLQWIVTISLSLHGLTGQVPKSIILPKRRNVCKPKTNTYFRSAKSNAFRHNHNLVIELQKNMYKWKYLCYRPCACFFFRKEDKYALTFTWTFSVGGVFSKAMCSASPFGVDSDTSIMKSSGSGSKHAIRSSSSSLEAEGTNCPWRGFFLAFGDGLALISPSQWCYSFDKPNNIFHEALKFAPWGHKAYIHG